MIIAFLAEAIPPQHALSYLSFLSFYRLCKEHSSYTCLWCTDVPDVQYNLIAMYSWREIPIKAPLLLFSSPSRASLRTKLYWKLYQRFFPIIFLYSHSPKSPPLLPLLKFSTAPYSEECTTILSFGDLHEESSHHLVIDAFSTLPSRIQRKHPLYIVGAPLSRKYIDRLKIHSYGLPVTIQETPSLTEDFLQKTKIHIILSPHRVPYLFQVMRVIRPTICLCESKIEFLYGQSAISLETTTTLPKMIRSLLKEDKKSHQFANMQRLNSYNTAKLHKQYLLLIQKFSST